MGASQFKPEGKHCVVSGGSEGLGLALACQLAALGAHISIISRSQSKLDRALPIIKSFAKSPTTQQFHSYACDLTSSSDSLATFMSLCAPFEGSPDFIFACAGGTIPGFFTDLTVEQHKAGMRWNYDTAINLVHPAVARMVKEEVKGKIVLVGSVLSFMGFAGYSGYSPSKYALRGLADCLRNEFHLNGITVHLFAPSTIMTPGFENEQRTKPDLTKRIEGPDVGVTAERCARELIRGLMRGDFYITYEPIGSMARCSPPIAPTNNPLVDAVYFIGGLIGFPIWRRFFADAEVKKTARLLAEKRKLESELRRD